PQWTIEHAIRALMRHGYSGAPVVDADGKLLGVLSEQDCIQFLASAAFHSMPSGLVADAMHRDVLTVLPTTELFRLTYLFHENPYRRIPVVDEQGALLGLVARRDLLRALDKILERRDTGHLESSYEAIQKHRD